MDFNKIFKYSWELFVKDIVPLIVGGLIAGIVGFITLGILAGPLYGGLIKMVLRRVREQKTPEIGDIFSAMDQFGTLFLTFLVLTILVLIGTFLCIIPGLLLATIWMYVVVYIVDKKVSMGEAMSKSKALVSQVGFGMHLVMLIIFGFISGILSITYIGSFVATPFIAVVVCVMYFIFNNEEHLLMQKAPGSVFEVQAAGINPNQPPVNTYNQPQSVQQGTNAPPPAAVPVPVQPQPPVQSVPNVASLVCSNCGNKGGAGAFCIECGAPLKVVCSKCRKELVSGAKFCPSCGSKLE